MKAAAQGYFGKALEELTLAQDAILAAIPQSPTAYDLVRNAEEVCLDKNIADGQECTNFKLVVPQDSEIVQRRNYVLDLMKTRSPLTGNKHTVAEYEAAKEEPVVLGPAGLGRLEGAAVRVAGPPRARPDPLPRHPDRLPEGRHRRLPGHHHPRLRDAEDRREVGLRRGSRPELQGPVGDPRQPQDPGQGAIWILGLRGHNIHNAAAAVMDYRTGEVLAYVGSASYTSKGNKKFQPQFDVLSDGWRQPGSSIKPIDYSIGIDDKTLTAATMFMDVTTNFGGGFIPTQADKLERGPVRLREALQFSLNIPAIKAAIMNGLDHVFDRTKDFGLSFPSGAVPVMSDGHRHARDPPDRHARRVRHDRQRRRS